MTPKQLAALESVAGRTLTDAEIAQIEPLLPDRLDIEIAAILSVGRTLRQLVPIADIQARLQSSGAWWAVKAALSSDVTPESVRGAAQAVMDVANARYVNVDMTIPLVSQMFGALVSAGLLPAETYDDIAGMSYLPDPIESRVVSDALNVAEGRMTL